MNAECTNPFITRNNDLFIMLIAGMGIHFASSYVIPISIQSQFLIVLSFSLIAGFLMNRLYQSLEWALFFLLGLQVVSLTPLVTFMVVSEQYTLVNLVQQGVASSRYSFFLLSSWLVGIPTGYILRKLFVGNYYRRGLF